MSFVLKDQHIPPTQPATFTYALNEKDLKARIAAEAATANTSTNKTRVQNND